MSRDGEFFNNVEEFDESRHLSSREIWDGLAKDLIGHFGDIVFEIKIKYEQEAERLANIKAVRKERGISNDDNTVIDARKEAARGQVKILEEYKRTQMAEQEAMAMRKRDSKSFLEKRRELTWKQEEMVKIFKEDFLKEIYNIFEKLALGGEGELRKIETQFAAADGGILPIKKLDDKNRQVHPDFARQVDQSSLGANVLSEGFFKLLKQEREIIDERLYGGKKDRPY